MRRIKSDIVSLRRKESVERKEAEKRREVYTVRKQNESMSDQTRESVRDRKKRKARIEK